MKFLIKIPWKLVLLTVLCISGIVVAYTYNSKADPKDFVGWGVIKAIQINIILYEYVIEWKVYKY